MITGSWSIFSNILFSLARALVWRCSTCGETQDIDTVIKMVRDAETFIRNNIGCDVDTDVLEGTIWALEKTFHPKHFLLAQVSTKNGIDKSYDDSVKLKRTEMDAIRLG